jgi:hypothetical protein
MVANHSSGNHAVFPSGNDGRVGPLIGTLAATLACSFLAKRIEVAKLYHFESDRRRMFRTET